MTFAKNNERRGRFVTPSLVQRVNFAYHGRVSNLTRPSRFLAALVTLFCLLFTQLAVAAYACPGVGAMTVAASSGSMPGCTDMDMPQPGLCAAHCEAGHQSLDTPGAPHVQPFVAGALALVLSGDSVQTAPAAAPHTDSLTRTTAPPLIIRNCCFRI